MQPTRRRQERILPRQWQLTTSYCALLIPLVALPGCAPRLALHTGIGLSDVMFESIGPEAERKQ